MSKRLQVVVGDADLERYTRTADAAGVSLSEWVRQALRVAERERAIGAVEDKLAVVRRAVAHETGGREVDVETMLAETEGGARARSTQGLRARAERDLRRCERPDVPGRAEHPHKADAQRLIEQLVREQRRLVTSSEVFQEILHRFVAIDRRDRIELAFETLKGVVEDVLAVEAADVFAAKDLIHGNPLLSARDALHVAVMRRCDLTEIVSFDRGFDAVVGITRLA